MSLPDSDSNTRPAGASDTKPPVAGSDDATIVGASAGATPTPTPPSAADSADETMVRAPSGTPPPPAPPPAPPAPAGPPRGGPDYTLPILIGVFVLALVGIGLLGLGIYAVMRLNSNPVAGTVPSTATLVPLATQVVLVPTTTPAPPATATPTEAPSATAPEATEATATGAAPLTATVSLTPTAAGNFLTVNQGANVRTGPGINYPVIGAIAAGGTAPVLGRDAFGGWFVISFSGGFGGQGWISSAVTTYNGDKSQLPVVAAPPPPAPTATPKPAGNPSGGLVTGAHGVSGMLNLCSPKVTFAIGERICFVEWIKNNTSQPVAYGILGVTAVRDSGGVYFQTSWSGEKAPHGLLGIDPGCIGPTDRCKGQWEDGMRLYNTGTYQLTLTVCFSDFPTCRGTSGDWEVLSGAIVVTVQ